MESVKLHTKVSAALYKSEKDILAYLRSVSGNEAWRDIEIQPILGGHNSRIFLVTFFDKKRNVLGRINVKFPINERAADNLLLERHILSLLGPASSEPIVPKAVGSTVLENENYNLLEYVAGQPITGMSVDLVFAEKVLNSILTHEQILDKKFDTLQHFHAISNNLLRRINYSHKIGRAIQEHAPHLNLSAPLEFLNTLLNQKSELKNRKLITDRSGGNILVTKNNKIAFIDFSTVRIGTRFDNWVQFIDDPRISFSCSREQLIQLFFKKNDLIHTHRELSLFHAASLYTNLMQSIFTHKKDPELSGAYLERANNAYTALTGKKTFTAP